MFDDEIVSIADVTPARLMQKLGVSAGADIHRRAISYAFHAAQQSYAPSKRVSEEARRETFDDLYERLYYRSELFEKYVDTIFPDHDPLRRGALALALTCNEALNISAQREEDTFHFGGFDEDTIELGVMFWEDALELLENGTKAISAGFEPESIFLAHINAANGMEVILHNYTEADPKFLRELDQNFFKPVREFLLTDTSIGRYVERKMILTQDIICKHLGGYKSGDRYTIPHNDNRLEI
jgi:hypothetical protein